MNNYGRAGVLAAASLAYGAYRGLQSIDRQASGTGHTLLPNASAAMYTDDALALAGGALVLTGSKRASGFAGRMVGKTLNMTVDQTKFALRHGNALTFGENAWKSKAEGGRLGGVLGVMTRTAERATNMLPGLSGLIPETRAGSGLTATEHATHMINNSGIAKSMEPLSWLGKMGEGTGRSVIFGGALAIGGLVAMAHQRRRREQNEVVGNVQRRGDGGVPDFGHAGVGLAAHYARH